jgi:hypothetical protein
MGEIMEKLVSSSFQSHPHSEASWTDEPGSEVPVSLCTPSTLSFPKKIRKYAVRCLASALVLKSSSWEDMGWNSSQG